MEWLCLDFLNSDYRNWRGSGERVDRLNQPEWWQKFSRKWILDLPMPTEPAVIAALTELRNYMRRVTEAVAARQAPDEQDLAGINRIAASVPTYRRLVYDPEAQYQVQEVVLGEGWEGLMGKILSSFGDLLTKGDPRRLKICENPNCLWVYYDESRNRSSRWCEDKTCGNLMKVRRFRERQKQKGGGAAEGED